MPEPPEVNLPFRWDLVTPDQLGSLLSGTAPPDLWFLDDLVPPGVHRLPFSFQRDPVIAGRTWRLRPLSTAERAQARRVLRGLRLDPTALARRDRPAVFVDVVHQGSTFTELFLLLRTWIDEQRAQWDVIRRKLRFVGVTVRRKTSPHTFPHRPAARRPVGQCRATVPG